MASARIKWQWIAGIAVIGIFLSLLAVRLGLLPSRNVSNETGPITQTEAGNDHETWMQILQNGRKIGYAYRVLAPASGGYEFRDDVFFRLNTMGVVQSLSFSIRGTLNRDMALSTFDIRLTSNLFRFTARGRCTGRQLTLYVGEPHDEKRYDILLKDPPYLSAHLGDVVFRSGLEIGGVKTISLFDPAGMGVRPAKVTLVGYETRTIQGVPVKLAKYAVDFLGARQYAWIDDKGRIIREQGMLGLSLERTTRKEARQGLAATDAVNTDMTALASVASPVIIHDPGVLDILKVKIGHIDPRHFALDGGRQYYRAGILTIQKERLDKRGGRQNPPDTKERDLLLQPTPFVQADHPAIKSVLKGIIKPEDKSGLRMQKITHWVYRHLEKQPILSVANAVETLVQRKGDCTEHAVLVAALGRAAGIPTTIETGLVYQQGRFYYHAWNIFYIAEWNQWVTADAVFDQVPADVTHIRLIRGEAQEQLELIGLLGRITLESVSK